MRAFTAEVVDVDGIHAARQFVVAALAREHADALRELYLRHAARPGSLERDPGDGSTPFTDGERIYASFGQNVGLFVFTMDGAPLWKKQWPPQQIYLDFGTASSPVVHDGRVYLVHDSEQLSYIAALDAKTGAEVWKTARPATGAPKSSWMTPFVWQHARRTEIVLSLCGLHKLPLAVTMAGGYGRDIGDSVDVYFDTVRLCHQWSRRGG